MSPLYTFWCLPAQRVCVSMWFFLKYELAMGMEMMQVHVLVWLEQTSIPWVILLSVSCEDRVVQSTLLSFSIASRHSVAPALPPAKGTKGFPERQQLHTASSSSREPPWHQENPFGVTPWTTMCCQQQHPETQRGQFVGAVVEGLQKHTQVKLQPRRSLCWHISHSRTPALASPVALWSWDR